MTVTPQRVSQTNTPGASARREAARLRAGTIRTVEPQRLYTIRSKGKCAVVATAYALAWVLLAYIAELGISLGLIAVLIGAIAYATARRRPVVGWSEPKTYKVPATPEALKEAERWERGAEGEEATYRILKPLEREGWVILNDRRIPERTANLDHILIGPQRQLLVIDSKNWKPVPGADVRPRSETTLMYGRWDCTEQVQKLLAEIESSLRDMLGEPQAVMVIHRAPMWGPLLRCRGVYVVSPERLVSWVRQSNKNPHLRVDLAAHIDYAFRPYV
ncbi:nuclease-related domain-containing protein [Kitasatospora terrestris]|uniref:NERD domain-containing protein n=1 Tax=Kitasatospora terrestris TaxID=258051 RepID=A0ABP9E5J5_9ACTN